MKSIFKFFAAKKSALEFKRRCEAKKEKEFFTPDDIEDVKEKLAEWEKGAEIAKNINPEIKGQVGSLSQEDAYLYYLYTLRPLLGEHLREKIEYMTNKTEAMLIKNKP